MTKAGTRYCCALARQVPEAIPDRPSSFEVFSDEIAAMERRAREMASLAGIVYVKISVTNTRGEPFYDLVRGLSHAGAKINLSRAHCRLAASR